MALGQNGNTQATTAIRVALRSADPEIAANAAGSLEMIGGRTGLELSAIALAHIDARVRLRGLFGAYRGNGARAIPLLERALTDSDSSVRKHAAEWLMDASDTSTTTGRAPSGQP